MLICCEGRAGRISINLRYLSFVEVNGKFTKLIDYDKVFITAATLYNKLPVLSNKGINLCHNLT